MKKEEDHKQRDPQSPLAPCRTEDNDKGGHYVLDAAKTSSHG